jgi:hypothetical protein
MVTLRDSATAAACEPPRGGWAVLSRAAETTLAAVAVRGTRPTCRKGWSRRRSRPSGGLLIEALLGNREPS